MKVRPATAADRSEWLRFREAVYGDDPDGEREIDQLLNDPLWAVYILERGNGGAGGFVEVGLRSHAEGCVTSPVGYIEGIYVDADLRRQGAARALFRAAEEWARAQGCREMASDALIDNEVSRVAHLAVGYEEVMMIRCFRKDL